MVDFLQRWERAASNLLGSVGDPLECFPIRSWAAAKPSALTVRQDAHDGAAVEGHQQFLTEVVFL